jgi:hypothetical protein
MIMMTRGEAGLCVFMSVSYIRLCELPQDRDCQLRAWNTVSISSVSLNWFYQGIRGRNHQSFKLW